MDIIQIADSMLENDQSESQEHFIEKMDITVDDNTSLAMKLLNQIMKFSKIVVLSISLQILRILTVMMMIHKHYQNRRNLLFLRTSY